MIISGLNHLKLIVGTYIMNGQLVPSPSFLFSFPDMMANCSTSGNISFDPLSCSQGNHYIACFRSMATISVYITFLITVVLILFPLCILIFYMGLQKWRRLHSLNNTDFFTINFAIMKLIGFLGHALSFCGIYFEYRILIDVGYILWAITWYGENLFHFLTCADRYLAVVHPVSYIHLKNQRWKRIRNITTGCVWIMPLLITSLMSFKMLAWILEFFLLVSSLILLIFLNVSVLCLLFHSGPRKQGKNKNRLDQSKQKTLYAITTILGLLILRFGWYFVWLLYEVLTHRDGCVFFIYGVWVDFPSTLILPFLFLQKTYKLKFCLSCKKPETQIN